MGYNTVTHFIWSEVRTSDNIVCKDAIVCSYPTVDWDWNQFGLKHITGYNNEVMNKLYAYVLQKYPLLSSIPNFKIFISTGVHQAINVPQRSPNKLDPYTVFLQSEECYVAYNDHITKGGSGIIFLHSTC
jgi:hypothetical protein